MRFGEILRTKSGAEEMEMEEWEEIVESSCLSESFIAKLLTPVVYTRRGPHSYITAVRFLFGKTVILLLFSFSFFSFL